jgi:hypothetical protein
MEIIVGSKAVRCTILDNVFMMLTLQGIDSKGCCITSGFADLLP